MANDNVPRSANQAYYASKQPLLFRSTKEGRKNPQPAPSYRHKTGDSAGSADKYYKTLESPAQTSDRIASNAAAVKLQVVTITAGSNTMPEVVSAIMGGATTIKIQGDAAAINKARAAVDIAVGRNTLTRAQADIVSYVTSKTDEVEVPKEPEALTLKADVPESPETGLTDKPVVLPHKKNTKKKNTKKKTTKKKTAAVEEEDNSDETDAILNPAPDETDAILNPVSETEEPDVVVLAESDSDKPEEAGISEDDVARAFGVTDHVAEVDSSDDVFDSDDD